MALVHTFCLVQENEKIKQVNIPDDLMNYIKDSFEWIKSLWNEKNLKFGLPYYGYAIIKTEEVVKLKEIIIRWRDLFSISTEVVNLTGSYLIDQMKYEKISYSKKELISIYDSLIQLCIDAEEMNIAIFYEGI